MLQENLKNKIAEFDRSVADLNSRTAASRDSIMNELIGRKHQLDHESKALETSFAQGQIDIDTFIRDFVSLRSHYYSLEKKLSLVRQ